MHGSGSDAAVYGLDLQCRAVASATDNAQHLFLLGTFSLRGQNQLILLEYREDSAFCDCLAMWKHPGEIWSLSACPSQDKNDWFFSVHTSQEMSSRSATLWSKEGGTSAGLTKVQALGIPVTKVLWEPQGIDLSTVLCVQGEGCATETQGVSSVKLDSGGAASVSSSISVAADCVHSGSWDPHHPGIACLAADSSLWYVDLRQRQPAHRIPAAHSVVRDCDFNPGKQYSFVSCGDDGCMKFWDLRKVSGGGGGSGALGSEAERCIKTVKAHDHWCCTARYNPYHEQLVLSSSTDRGAAVKLWNMPSMAHGTEGGSSDKDGLLRAISDYEDSVYSVAWSSCSPWVFASVSYNGKVLVHQVPREVKLGILLADSEFDHDQSQGV
eukprot:TRINITY_DN23801_c0_g1_i1.p1 TRINITY_DN23801_c0_g1~~TRINITY_DN23801_c0_g1_i1.p1  ORF type:complete len:382 (+),score=46.73 TRINITY_DN23801_c0_g1_i1:68-1213(+)